MGGQLMSVLIDGILLVLLFSLAKWAEARIDRVEQEIKYDINKALDCVQQRIVALEQRLHALENRDAETKTKSS